MNGLNVENLLGKEIVGMKSKLDLERARSNVVFEKSVSDRSELQSTRTRLQAADLELYDTSARFTAHHASSQKELKGTQAELAALQVELASKLAKLQQVGDLESEVELARSDIRELRVAERLAAQEKAELMYELDMTKKSLASARKIVIDVRNQRQAEGITARSECSTISGKLFATQKDLTTSEAKLFAAQHDLSTTNSQLSSCRSQFVSCRIALAATSAEAEAGALRVNKLQASNTHLRTEVEQLTKADAISRQRIFDLEAQLVETRRRFSVAHVESLQWRGRAKTLQREVGHIRDRRVDEELPKLPSLPGSEVEKGAKSVLSRVIHWQTRVQPPTPLLRLRSPTPTSFHYPLPGSTEAGGLV